LRSPALYRGEEARRLPLTIRRPRAKSQRPPLWLLVAGGLVAAAAVLPLAYLVVVIGDAAGDAWDAIWRERTAELVLRSLGLTAAVTATAVAIAVPAAWLTVRTDLPGRRIWTVLLTLPLVVPSYIGAYALISALGPRGLAADVLGVGELPSITGFPGAWLALSLFTYPYVLIPVRATLRRLDPQIEEAALGMGRAPSDVFRTVVLPQIRPAIGAGALLVALYVLHDFGAVSIMRFDSFTTAIYTSYLSSFDRTAAAALSALLVALMFVVLWFENRSRRAETLYRSGPGSQRGPRTIHLGRWRLPALAFCGTVAAFALLLPIVVLAYWSLQSVAGDVDWGEIASAAGNSLLAAGICAGVAGLCALPVAVLSVRFRGRYSSAIERLSYIGHALPAIVVALSLVFFGTRAVIELYQTLGMLIFAWVVLFLPLAVGIVRASLLQISPRIEEAARSVGRSHANVLRTITVPLLAGGLLAGCALVFLTAIKELPATLILGPTGFETLATEIWSATGRGFFEGAAVPALILLGVSAVPAYLFAVRE
jgi:iron(III) transport system permease protein